MSNKKTNLAILASGSGTNAENITRHFQDNPDIDISLLISNKRDAKALSRVGKYKVPTEVITNSQWKDPNNVLPVLESYNIHFIILAGFLILIPSYLTKNYAGKIINIHPALLPDFGGKGMYGHNVHKAVIASGKKESGITIHYVNENYDEGDIIFQAKCKVPGDLSPDSLAEQIHSLEYKYYPKVIECLVKGDIK